MTVINEFQQLILFVFELHFYVIGNMSVKPIVKFVISLTSLFFLKKYQLFKKCYILIKIWVFYGGRLGPFLVGNFCCCCCCCCCCGALGLGLGSTLPK